MTRRNPAVSDGAADLKWSKDSADVGAYLASRERVYARLTPEQLERLDALRESDYDVDQALKILEGNDFTLQAEVDRLNAELADIRAQLDSAA